ncbi:MAG: GNAT family N-acetyltransferase [Bacteroidia bacterium]|nr:GNAT family N-acetyltransferase [Bacteroidia bacterium]
MIYSNDPNLLDANAIHAYLTQSYWAEGRTLDRVRKSIQNSHCGGLYQEKNQIGFGRLITDYCTFGYLADVYVLPEWQGKGLGKWLVENLLNDPALSEVTRFMLGTRDAHTLYQQFGFNTPALPDRWMEKVIPQSKK